MLKHVDHTQLKAFAKWESIDKLCKEAIENDCACVCIPPAYVKRVAEAYPNIKISCVVGFPLGYNTTAVKVFETKEAIKEGASEIDVVINIGWAKDHLYEKITDELKQVKEACKDVCLKVIIETCYLDEDEKIALCKCVTDTKADYIKTSTGFGSAGATLDDVKLFKQHIGEGVKIKAAGGIRTKEDIAAYLQEGVDRIGCSAAVEALGK